ncbi:MAG TPA: tRNA lysidine(34) synthetase TilS, partial [Dehalococcoidia bacterium]|nr:tRNA lysidine(34) synthetase TilS [Dehalococcoidia bacterium]
MSRNSHSRFPARIESRVSRFIEEHHLLGAGEKVLVAISGGADSTALLLILERLLKKKAIAIVAAHFDHRLRGPVEGEADLAFVQGLIGDLGVDCVTGGGEVRQHARRKKISLEDAARSLRYQFLASEASRLGAGVVATGHTKDDQAETVLLHILRGSGVDGLRGMRPRSSWPLGPGPQLIRPLLILSREETRRYCGDRGIVPREDYTNLLLEATRNRIRHQALPLLKEFNPRLTDALQRLADAAALDSEYLNTLAEAHWGELARIEKRAVVLDRKVFQGLPPALGLRLLRKAVEAFMEHPPQLEAVHLHAVLAALSKERSRVSLPLDLELEITARHLRLR